MQFITDVTIPDGTIMTPGQAFTKTWRIKNVGTCTWTPSYAVVFSSGNSMNGPATQALTGNVNPGDQIDIPVNLTAPASPGNYTGYWKLRDSSGVLFDQFYVQIKVQNAVTATYTLPPAVALAVLTNISGESGQVRSNGSVLGPTNAGDLTDGTVAEAFVSFDMTSIPAGANVTKVVVDFGTGHDILGNPWSLGIGCLHAYTQNYGSLDAGDFTSGDPTGAVTKWCGDAELNSVFESTDMKGVVQNAVGHSRLQLRLQFRAPTTNSDGIADTIRLGPVKLTVTYQ
jgi:Ig-like domain from next to BRCA1 gene